MGPMPGHGGPIQGPSVLSLIPLWKTGIFTLPPRLASSWIAWTLGFGFPRCEMKRLFRLSTPGPGTGQTVHRLVLRSPSPSLGPHPAPPCALALAVKLGHPLPCPLFRPQPGLVWRVRGTGSGPDSRPR